MQPAADGPAGGSEFALRLDDAGAVDRMMGRLADLGASILQEPVQMDFGYTGTALSPDGHRIRAFARPVLNSGL